MEGRKRRHLEGSRGERELHGSKPPSSIPKGKFVLFNDIARAHRFSYHFKHTVMVTFLFERKHAVITYATLSDKQQGISYMYFLTDRTAHHRL